MSPKLPESLKLSELTDILKSHFTPKPLVFAERFHFHQRFQAANELVAEFMAQLQHLAEHCDFRDYLEQALRDWLVCSLRNEGIQRRLLAESDLTLTRALELAQGMEAAKRNAKSLEWVETVVHKMTATASRPSTLRPCHRCGRSNHEAEDCCFHEAVCHFCNKKGHIAPVCRSKQQLGTTHPAHKTSNFNNRPNRHRSQPTKYVSADDEKPKACDTELPMFTIGKLMSRLFLTDMLVNGKRIRMEIDTGAAVSIISKDQQKLLLPDAH